MKLSPKAEALILEYEGFDQPGRWPGGQSGITLAYGYDIGYCTRDQFLSDWGERLPAAAVQRLVEAVGLTGLRARNRAPQLIDIRIPKKAADEVFRLRSVPRMLTTALLTFPGIDRLLPDPAGALVSLVYNRGGSMKDKPGEDNRREMRAIRDECAKPNADRRAIAAQIRSMKRLWQGKGLDGLLRRREAEAALMET